MEETHKSLKDKVLNLMKELKTLSENYELTKFDIDIVLHNKIEKNNITLKISDENVVISNSKDKTKKESVTENATVTEGGTLRSLSSDNTLSTSIFNTSVTDDSEYLKTEDYSMSKTDLSSNDNQRVNSKESVEKLRGGFLKVSKKSNNVNFSTTSEINTQIKNLYNSPNNISLTSDFLVGGNKQEFSATSLSATSAFSVGGNKQEFSATSLSATSDNKISANKQEFSATSLSATSDFSVGGNKQEFSATSLSSKSNKISVNKQDFSATSDFKVGGGLITNIFSETSQTTTIMQKNKKENPLTKMDLIRQKIKELDSTSEQKIFKKNVQSGGGDKLRQIKQNIGINSSSTSSLCE